MQKLNISKISTSFLKTKVQKIEGHQTNPFGVSFKGSVLTADVFEKKGGESLIKNISKKSKLLSSTVVGSIAKMSSAIGTRLNSAVSFGNRIKENVSGLWEQAKSIEITFETANLASAIKSKVLQTLPSVRNRNSVKQLSKLPVEELEGMLTQALEKV